MPRPLPELLTREPHNQREALTLALYLALLAPTDTQAETPAHCAEGLARSLSPADVDLAKQTALLAARDSR